MRPQTQTLDGKRWTLPLAPNFNPKSLVTACSPREPRQNHEKSCVGAVPKRRIDPCLKHRKHRRLARYENLLHAQSPIDQARVYECCDTKLPKNREKVAEDAHPLPSHLRYGSDYTPTNRTLLMWAPIVPTQMHRTANSSRVPAPLCSLGKYKNDFNSYLLCKDPKQLRTYSQRACHP